jgi:hypothetical protein
MASPKITVIRIRNPPPSGGGGTPAGADGSLQFNDNGAFAGAIRTYWNEDDPDDAYLTLKAGSNQSDPLIELQDVNGVRAVSFYADGQTGRATIITDDNGSTRVILDVGGLSTGGTLKLLEGLGYILSKGNGTVVMQMGVNNLTGIAIYRKTNTSPTGNFQSFLSATGASLYTVDINGCPILTPQDRSLLSPVEGMLCADTDHHLYYYNGTAWKQLDN